jgi:arginine-tRNA-protein transferase
MRRLKRRFWKRRPWKKRQSKSKIPTKWRTPRRTSFNSIKAGDFAWIVQGSDLSPSFQSAKVENFAFINEQFFASRVGPAKADQLLAQGWRHFGEHFFRYNLGYYEEEIRRVYALRVDLSEFKFSKSQRRTLNRNADLESRIALAEISKATHELFERHKKRFTHGVPESIYDFLSPAPATVPSETYECAIVNGERVLATSYFDVGLESVSSIYAMFEPEETRRSLGILTMLREIGFALENGKKYYYHGYIYEGESFYDYKKRLSGLEIYDWQGSWLKFED